MQHLRNHDSCCPEPDKGSACQRTTAAEPLDVTLSSCCKRDALDQKRVARAKEALLAVDRVDARLRLRDQALKYRSDTRENASDSEDTDSDAEGPTLVPSCLRV